ncbi:MAG: hypothetical protein HFE63_10050 [Clostridiales bacterium]|nr:hypothetical protein [Clostridiales bacterium]
MKRIYKLSILPLLLAALTGQASAAGNYKLSPGLEVIAAEYPMVKTGITGTDIRFTDSDFADALGIEKVSKITVTGLPDSTVGKLMLGNQAVTEGQVIARKNLSSLRFVPTSSTELEASFSFCAGSSPLSAEYDCTVFALSTINSAPVFYQPEAATVGIYSGVSYLGTLKAVDPENDSLRYEIMSMPAGGSVKLTDKELGYYVYSPRADFEGNDSFTVRAVDKYGNKSNTVKVSLKVDKADISEVFADMDGHWANSAVITCVRNGIISTSESDKFYPDEPMSRAEFLSLIMNAAGYSGFSIANTGFADDDIIPVEYKGCIAAAEALGVVNGIETDAGLVFCPNNQITRAEASVMLTRLTGIGLSNNESLAVFADNESPDSIPTWAKSSMRALNAEGILRGNGSSLAPYDVITRAAAAQLAAALLTR